MGETNAKQGAVPHRLFGRRRLMTPYARITRENVLEVFETVRYDMEVNFLQTQTLYRYFVGEQNILHREKEVRPEICNRATENHAAQIVRFKTGHIFGEPIRYVCRAAEKGAESHGVLGMLKRAVSGENRISERITDLNEMMHVAGKAALDMELGEWMFTCGVGYRLLLPDPTERLPFLIDTLDPRFTAVVYTTEAGRAPVMSIQKKADVNGDDVFWCYTPDTLYRIREGIVEDAQDNPLGFIPVYEYTTGLARMGGFEPAINLLDALNVVVNNRLDGLEQFIQAFMVCENVKIDSTLWDRLREEGLLSYTSDPGNPGKVYMISSELNQSQVQTLKDDILQQILTICDMPDRNGSSRTTGDTGQAVILRDGWSSAESYAKAVVLCFEPVEKRFLYDLLSLLDAKNVPLGITVGDIGIKFTRNMTDNMLTKTQALQNMLEAGVAPRIAISHCNMFSDPEQVYMDSLPYLRKWELAAESEPQETPANNKPNPSEADE